MSQFWLPKQRLTCRTQMGDSSSTCSDPDMCLTPTVGRYLLEEMCISGSGPIFCSDISSEKWNWSIPREHGECCNNCLSTMLHRHVHPSHHAPRTWYHAAIYVSALLVLQYSSVAIQAQLCSSWWSGPPADGGRDLHLGTCSVSLTESRPLSAGTSVGC